MINYAGTIKLVLFDVDGVLTDGSLYVGRDGESFKKFNVRDGIAFALLGQHGIRTGVISGKSSESLDYRINELGVELVSTGSLRKVEAYRRIVAGCGLTDSEVAYVGDDIVDAPLIGVVGAFLAPSDAHPLVRGGADHVLDSRGGAGAAREVAEHILSLGGLNLVDMYDRMISTMGEDDSVAQ